MQTFTSGHLFIGGNYIDASKGETVCPDSTKVTVFLTLAEAKVEWKRLNPKAKVSDFPNADIGGVL